MKKTINEIYELIKQKIENAERDIQISSNTMKEAKNSEEWLDAKMRSKELKGEVEAYTDIICLIESSQVLNNGLSSNDIFINWLKSVIEVFNINKFGTVEILDIKVKDGFNNNEVLSVIKEWLNS